MFKINEDKSIYLTRGDIANIKVRANKTENEAYVFQPRDIVRMQVFEKSKCNCVVMKKEVEVTEETSTVDIFLNKKDTSIGENINKPIDYWYEIELNPDTNPQTIVGYDDYGAKILRLFPEGGDGNE